MRLAFFIARNFVTVADVDFHKSQIFFYSLSAFILGVLIASFFDFSVRMVLMLIIVGISIIILSGFKNKLIILAGFLILAFAGGGARFDSFNNSFSSLGDYIGQEVSLSGFVDSEPEIDGNRARFVFSADLVPLEASAMAQGGSLPAEFGRRGASGGKNKNERILVTTNSFPKREFGSQLLMKGELALPQNFTDFDYITYLKKDGIRMTIFYPKEIEASDIDLRWSERIRVSIYQNIFVVKNKFQNAINSSIPEPNAAFINGILLGARQNIPDDLKDAFSKTGTTHILAISGYNIMIISWAVLMGLIWFFRRRVAFWISVGVVILFVILTGASASVARAAVMGLLLSFAHGYGRLYDQKNSIILAGGVMIYHNPFVLVFDVGFQLSFAAVLGLIYLYPWLDWKFRRIPEWGKLKEITLMTISAQLAVSPLIIYYFGNFSLISLPANILILPFVPAAMLLGFITGLVGTVYQPMAQIIGHIAWAITEYQIDVARYLSL